MFLLLSGSPLIVLAVEMVDFSASRAGVLASAPLVLFALLLLLLLSGITLRDHSIMLGHRHRGICGVHSEIFNKRARIT